MPLEFEPGSKYQYSNAGMNTAARIVEVASGMPYAEYLDRRLFQPLGMKDTTFWPNAEQVARDGEVVQADRRQEGPRRDDHLSAALSAGRPQPAGVSGSGLFSTAADLSIFYRMIANQGVFGGRRYLSERRSRK